MAVDPVPWFVGGGAQHSPEVARLLAYAAARGNEGVVGLGDLAVRPLAVPGTSVRVLPGAAFVIARWAGASYQAYAGRIVSEETLPIAATGSGSGRSDMIVLRVEDPYAPGEPWAAPPDPAAGPYLHLRVIAGVPSTATTVTELGLGHSAIPLARVDLPPSTGTVTAGMIVDLRRIANPRRDRTLITSFPATTDDLTQSSWRDWPTAAARTVAVPAWASHLRVVTHIAGAVVWIDKCNGYLRHRVGSGGVFGQNTRFDINSVVGGDALDRTFALADSTPIPAALRGTTIVIAPQAYLDHRGATGQGYIRAYNRTSVITDVEFSEVPE